MDGWPVASSFTAANLLSPLPDRYYFSFRAEFLTDLGECIIFS
jgi:hypothetical protein